MQILKSSESKYDIGFSKSLILQKSNGDEKFIDYLLEDSKESDMVYKKNEKWIIKGVKITLNTEDELLKDKLLSKLNEEGFVTSSLEELSLINNCKQEKTKKVLNILERDNQVIRINQALIFSMKNIDDLIHQTWIFSLLVY